MQAPETDSDITYILEFSDNHVYDHERQRWYAKTDRLYEQRGTNSQKNQKKCEKSKAQTKCL